MHVPYCQHVRTNGAQCQSPAMEHYIYCYFHQNILRRHKNYRCTDRNREYTTALHGIELTALEDTESVQVAISCAVNAFANGTLDIKRTRLLFQGLQLAATNAARLKPAPKPHEMVRDISTTADGLDLASWLTSPAPSSPPSPQPTSSWLSRGEEPLQPFPTEQV